MQRTQHTGPAETQQPERTARGPGVEAAKGILPGPLPRLAGLTRQTQLSPEACRTLTVPP